MEQKLLCDGCGRRIQVMSVAAGDIRTFPCPNCGRILDLPLNELGPGDVICGFRLDKLLGTGSMGDVFLSKQLSMDRDVALKILTVDSDMNDRATDDFLNEIKTLAKLDHPNIVGAIEAGEENGRYFVAMQYVSGETLDHRIERDGALDERTVLTIGLKLSQALGYAWSQYGLLHRDLKPENIMLKERDEPVLLDLGLCKVYGSESHNTVQGMVLGTPYYMSPEQATDSSTVSYKADIYSLGCTLFHAMTGEVPYEADDPIRVMTKHKLDPIPSPKQINPDISDAADGLLRQMMAKYPEKRHSSWSDLIAHITSVLAPRPEKRGGGGRKKRPAQDFPAGATETVRRKRLQSGVESRPAKLQTTDAVRDPDESGEVGVAKKPRDNSKLAIMAVVGLGALFLVVLIGSLVLTALANRTKQKEPPPVAVVEPPQPVAPERKPLPKNPKPKPPKPVPRKPRNPRKLKLPGKPVPKPWQCDYVGKGRNVKATLDKTVLHVAADGKDIWGAADTFGYLHLPVPGDVMVIARIDGMTKAGTWAKAGIMIRGDMKAGSSNVLLALTNGEGIIEQIRAKANGKTTNLYHAISRLHSPFFASDYSTDLRRISGSIGKLTAPQWLMLVRSGTMVRSYFSGDGRRWRPLATKAIVYPGSTVQVGLAVSSNMPGKMCVAKFGTVKLKKPSSELGVVRVELVNMDTGEKIRTLYDGARISLSKDGRNLGFRPVFRGKTASCKFMIAGNVVNQTKAPFLLVAQVPAVEVDSDSSWYCRNYLHRLEITPYAKAGEDSSAGHGLLIRYKVVE